MAVQSCTVVTDIGSILLRFIVFSTVVSGWNERGGGGVVVVCSMQSRETVSCYRFQASLRKVRLSDV